MQQFGPYQLVRQVAVGGMAELFLAKVTGIEGFEKFVALKMIHPNFAESPEFITMLIGEAKLAVQLTHPNIAQTFDLGRVGETYYITMEYVDGVDLYRLIRAATNVGMPLPIDACAFVAKQIAAALEHAHARCDDEERPLGIVHRDVSPQNVLLSYDGEVKLVDFGIAQASLIVSQTAVGVIKGKYYYMSPEQAKGGGLDGRSDIYSAGIVLYQMLTGRTVHIDEDIGELLDKIREGNAEPPSRFRPGLPPPLERIVMRALTPDRAKRYQHAAEMGHDLQQFLAVHAPKYVPATLGALVNQLVERAHVKEVRAASKGDVDVDLELSGLRTLRVHKDKIAHDGVRDSNSVIARLGGRARTPRRLEREIGPTTTERFGRFDIHERLGAGGMATVHRASYQAGRGQRHEVALKRLLTELAHNTVFVASFQREATMLAQLRHPNIVGVLEAGHIGETYFLAMELVRGTVLREVMRRAYAAPVGVALHVIGELLDALEYAYASIGDDGKPMHIIHRDLSPGNLLISEDGHVKVIDFGIAKSTEGAFATDSGLVKGKLGYMAPEALSKQPLDARTDVFGVGVIAWEMLAGKRLLKVRGVKEAVEQLLTLDVPPPSKHNKHCPPELDQIIRKALAIDPALRWQSAGEMRAALSALAERYANKVSATSVAVWVEAYMHQREVEEEPARPPPSKRPITVEIAQDDDEIVLSIGDSSKQIRMNSVAFKPSRFETGPMAGWTEDGSKQISIESGPYDPDFDEDRSKRTRIESADDLDDGIATNESKMITIEPGASQTLRDAAAPDEDEP